jgi:sodium-dependent dicarboxylate transporter 2/3/5
MEKKKKKKKKKMVNWKSVAWYAKMLIPIVIAFPFLFKLVYIDESRPAAGPCLGVTIITAAYWIFEPIPIVITAFFPIFLLPILNVSTAPKIANSMFTDTSIVFIGGFIFSIAMVRWNLHSRIALKTVVIFGLRPKLLLLGICLVTSFLSCWISNTACALTMVPNALAIVEKLEEITGDPESIVPFGKALLIMVAMASSAAGMITIIGTPPNLILAQTVQNLFPGANDIGFTQFIFVTLPLVFLMLAVLYLFFLVFYMKKIHLPENIDESEFKNNYERLGKMSIPEKIIVVFFVILALLWLFRSDINFGAFTLKGWSSLIYGKIGATYIKDGTIALTLAMMFFIIRVPQGTEKEIKTRKALEIDLELRSKPRKSIIKRFRSPLELPSTDSDDGALEEEDMHDDEAQEEGKSEWVPILTWEYTQQKMPWTILFLFAGGFALNQGFKDSGLDSWIGERLNGITSLPMYPLILVVTITTMAMTNIVASNTAVANILLPIVASVAKMSGTIHPYLVMFPTAFSCSFSFIIPVSTPPNLIAYSTGKLETKDFIICGSVLTLAAIIFVPPICMWIIPPVFDAHTFPDWANTTST